MNIKKKLITNLIIGLTLLPISLQASQFKPTRSVWVDQNGNIIYKVPQRHVSLSGEVNPSINTYDKYPYVRLVENGDGQWDMEYLDYGEFVALELSLSKIGDRLIGDFDGDGNPDILIQTELGQEVLVSKQKAKNYRIGVNLFSDDLVAKDLNNDQRLDLVNEKNGTVRYAQQTGLSNSINVNDYVGTLSAESNVSPSGEFTYKIPITVSESTGGFKPEFSFNYSSGGRNGPLGVGWSISGLDVISRCEKNMETDGEPGQVTFSATDRFCMNGQRLLIKNGQTYGRNNTEYRLQQDDGQKIIAHTSNNAKGPDGFTVYDTEGNKYFFGKYGSTYDAKISTSLGIAYTWALKRVEDTSGNYYQYLYEKQSGSLEYRVKEINYSGHGSSSTKNKLTFEWENRSDTNKVGYIYGQKNSLTKRLKSLKSYYSGRLVREYKLVYQYEHYLLGNTSASKLVSIQACNGSSNCLSPTKFTWTQRTLGSSQLNNPISKEYSHNSRYKAHKLMDFNGDGLLDIAYVRNDRGSSTDHLYMIPNTRYGFGSEKRLYNKASKSFRRSWKITDYDRDGKDDILYIDGSKRWRLLKHSSGTTFVDSIVSAARTVSSDSNSRFADVTGDGYKDLLHIVNGRMVMQRGLKAAGVSSTATNISYLINKGSATTVSPVDYDEDDNSYPTADFNGDGRADFIVKVRKTTRNDDPGPGPGPGPGPCEEPFSNANPSISRLPFPCDLRSLNGTKLAKNDKTEAELSGLEIHPTMESELSDVDFTYVNDEKNEDNIGAISKGADVQAYSSSTSYDWRILVSDGNATLKEYANLGSTSYQDNLMTADLNGDGLTDVLYQNSNDDWYARINKGNSFSSGIFVTSDNNKNFVGLVDINNDGSQEVFVEISGGDYFYFFNGTNFTGKRFNSINTDYDFTSWVDLSGDGVPDRFKFSGRLYMHISRDSGEPRISRVTNGFGAVTNVGYSTLVDSGVYTKETDANQYNWGNHGRVQDLKGAMRVVKSLTKDQETLSYHYRGGKAQVGRGLLGYRQVEIKSNRANTRVVTTYRQDGIYRGSVIQTQTYVKPAGTGGGTLPPPPPIDPCEENPRWCECGINPRAVENTINALPCNDFRNFASTEIVVTDSSILPTPSSLNTAGYQTVSSSNSSSSWLLKSSTVTNYATKAQTSFKIGSLTTATRVYPNQSTSITYNTDSSVGDVLATQTRSVQIDNYGNITNKIVNVTSEHGNSSETTTANFDFRFYGGRKSKETVVKSFTNKLFGQSSSSDSKTFVTQYGYDGKGQLTSKTDDNGVLTQYKRNTTYGLVYQEVTSKSGLPTRTTTYEFDPTYRHVTAQKNSLNHRSTTAYDSLGRKSYVQSANGQRTYSEYNALGRLISEISTPANSTSKTSSLALTKSMSQYWCQSVSHCPSSAVYYEEVQQEGKPDGRVYYDAYGRERRKSSAGLASNTWINVDIGYDSKGRKISETLPHFSSNSSPAKSTILYDGQNRVKQITKADGSIWKTEYAGLAITSTNPDGHSNTQLKNVMGHLLQVTDAKGKKAHYRYDANGKANRLTGPNNKPIQVIHDKYGNKTKLIDPDKGTITYGYDNYFQLTWQQDARGVRVENQYDTIGRAKRTLRYMPGRVLEQDVRYTYDTGSYAKGQVYEVKDIKSGYTNRFSYDGFGRKSRQTTIIDGDSYTESWSFNNAGQLQLETDATGQSVRYNYNGNNHLTSLYDNQSHKTIWQANEIDALGNVVNETIGGIITRTKDFDIAKGMVTRLEARKGSSTLQDLSYRWDDLGNLSSRRDNKLNKQESFEYDDLNRVTKSLIQSGDTTVIRYDDTGNITYKTGVGTYSYQSSRPHAVTKVTGEMANNYQYDASGNMVRDNQRVLNYNTYDKPIYIGKTGYWIKFAYSHSGRRYKRMEHGGNLQQLVNLGLTNNISSSTATKVTRYVGKVEFVQVTGSNQWLQRRYIAGKVLITSVNTNENSPTLRYLLDDHLGSTHVITRANGTIEETMSFDVFGARRNATTWKREHKKINQYTSSITLRGYTGHEQMDEVGLVHMGGRIYDPILGRFLQADPMIQAPQNIQSLNRYSYVMNNPLNKTDPSGYIWATLATLILKYIAVNTTSLALASAIQFTLTAYTYYGYATLAISAIQVAGGNSAEMAAFVGGLAKSYAKSIAIGLALSITGLESINRDYKNKIQGNPETDMSEAGPISKADASALALASYGDKDAPEGWSKLGEKGLKKFGLKESDLNTDSGLNAVIYYNSEQNIYAVAYAGTVLSQWGDIKTNFLQNFGIESEQYTDAMKLASIVTDKVGESELAFVGHSLGGGLASAASEVTGKFAYTFNAAGLNPDTVGGNISAQSNKLIRAYFSPSDPLSLLQDRGIPFLTNEAIGTRIMIRGASGHGMESMAQALK